MNERLDVLLSARHDGDLDTSEGAELDRLLADSESARARAASFEDVDAQLRLLAAEPLAEERLAHDLARLRERSDGELPARPATPGVRRGRLFGVQAGYRYGLALAAAVAAVWIASVVLPRTGVETETGVGEQPEAARETIAADALADLGIDRVGDLEVIDELELLEFLAARERSEEGPRG